MCVNSCAVLVPLKSSEKGATSRISSKRAGCGGRLMGLVPYLPWSKTWVQPLVIPASRMGFLWKWVYLYIYILNILLYYVYISIYEPLFVRAWPSVLWEQCFDHGTCCAKKLQFLVISPVIAVLMSRPMFKTYMAVCQNPCSTPSVHIKIAGIYGCEWMWITP